MPDLNDEPARDRLRNAIERRGWLTEADAWIAAGGPPDRAADLVRRMRPRLRRLGGLLIDPDQARLAERRILSALRRMHREDPLASGFRVDAVLSRALASPDLRPATHRGAGRLHLDHRPLRALVEDMVSRGRLVADGRRIRLSDHRPELGLDMRRRADELLGELRAAGASPPRAAAVARRVGLPEPVLDHLRATGELVAVAPEIDYPDDVYRQLRDAALGFAGEHGRLPSVAEYRSAIGASRRYAAALLERIRR
jgi:hypothetical protein